MRRSAGSPCMSGRRPRAGSDSAIDRDLDESMVQQVAAPGIQIKVETKPAFLYLHTDFPERYYGNRGLAF